MQSWAPLPFLLRRNKRLLGGHTGFCNLILQILVVAAALDPAFLQQVEDDLSWGKN